MRGVPKLLHVCPWIKTTGGVETLLAHHAHADARLGFDDWQLGLFDRTPPKPGERYSTHRFGWKHTPRGMRRAIARSFEARAGSIVAWHNAWGLPWFADLDRSARRIACLQDSVTHFGPLLPGVAQWADGITCLSRSAAADILERLPGWPAERLVVLPLPLAPRGNPNLDRRPGRPLVVGAAGRLVRPQKRWDRLVPFVEELRRLGVDYRIEVTSGGPLLPWLKKRLGADARVNFAGWEGPENYWRRLQSWDAAVSFTDHEGGPIVLLETMAAGAIPLYPKIGGSLGDDYAGQVDPRCHYPAGEPVAAARALQSLFASPPEQIAAMRRRAHDLVMPHANDAYERVFAEFAHRIAALPRISPPSAADRPARLTDRLPLGLITRTLPGALLR